MGLVRLRQRQITDHAPRSTPHVTRTGLAEDHQMLSEIYNRFTEGFDTKDLREAKALLEELGELAAGIRGNGKRETPKTS